MRIHASEIRNLKTWLSLFLFIITTSILYAQTGVGVGATSFVPVQMLDVRGNTNVMADSNYRINNTRVLSTKGTRNTFVGSNAGISNTTGYSNTFVGHVAGRSNTTAYQNTFVGDSAGYANTTAFGVVAVGYRAGRSNTTTGGCLFIGFDAGTKSTGAANTYIGGYGGAKSTTAQFNTVVGFASGFENTTGSRNTFLGAMAGQSVGNAIYPPGGTYSSNAFIGSYAGASIVYADSTVLVGPRTGPTGPGAAANSSTIVGASAGNGSGMSQSSNHNSFFGCRTGYGNSDGHHNSFFGWNAGSSNTSGTYNTYIGNNASGSATLTKAVAIGHNASVTTSNSMVLGGTGADAVNVGIGTTAPTSKLQVVGLPVHANNAAAIAGGLTVGAFYRTGGDPDLVCVVH